MGIDLRMAAAVSADRRRMAALEAGDQFKVVLVVSAWGKTEKVKIDYQRKKAEHPLVPEEVEEARSTSTGTTEYLSAVEFSPDGKTMIGAVRFHWECSGGKVTRQVTESHLITWDASTGKEIWKSLAPAPDIRVILFPTDGKTVTVVDQSGIGFWDFATGRELRRWKSKAPLFSARYSRAAACSRRGAEEVLLWDVATARSAIGWRFPEGNQEHRLQPDGKLLAPEAKRRFDSGTRLPARLVIARLPNPVRRSRFSADGKTLFQAMNRRMSCALGCRRSQAVGGIQEPNCSGAHAVVFPGQSQDSGILDGEAFGSGRPRPATCSLPAKTMMPCGRNGSPPRREPTLLRCEEGIAAHSPCS